MMYKGISISALLSATAYLLQLSAVAQPIAQLGTTNAQRAVTPGNITQSTAIKTLTAAPDLSFYEVQVHYPQLNHSMRMIGPDAIVQNTVLNIVESPSSNRPATTAVTMGGVTEALTVRSCNEPLQAKLRVWVANSGASALDANTPQLGLTGTVANQPVQSALGPIPASTTNKYFELGSFNLPVGTHNMSLTLNSSKGAGEANFANNTLNTRFEIRCLPPSFAPKSLNTQALSVNPNAAATANIKTATTAAIPAAGASSSQSGISATVGAAAVSAGGAAKAMMIHDLLKQPDSTVVEKNGQKLTVGQIKAKLYAKPNAPSALVKPANLVSKASKVQVPSDIKPYVAVGGPPPGGSNTQVMVSAHLAERSVLGSSAAAIAKGCTDTDAPRVTRLSTQDVAPATAVTIKGICLGKNAGEVRMTGNFPGGAVKLSVLHWDESGIVTQVPDNITGVGNGQARIEVFTSDRKVANSKDVNFWARREIVDVTHLWKCQGCANKQDDNHIIRYGGNNAYSKYWFTKHTILITDDIYGWKDNENWRIETNPQCTLEGIWWSGWANSVKGWEDGPPHISNIKVFVTWNSWIQEGWWNDTEVNEYSFNLFANASCPVGVSPNP